jgi:hypothetical protein
MNFKFLFIGEPVGSNAKCKMHNARVAKGDELKSFPQKIPLFCILHYAL